MKTVILVNVGTPGSPEPEAVGEYLREFLMDENIIPLRRPFRDLLVKGLIVPRRKFKSSEKYQKIWNEEGSPLMVESIRLQKKLQTQLGEGWKVQLGMQVGAPSVKETLKQAFEQSKQIYFCPLYPQYATATTGGSIQALERTLKKRDSSSETPHIETLRPFFQEDWFIESVSQKISGCLRPNDHLLLSYHGLPISQLKKHNSDCYRSSTCCLKPDACALNCYKAQCLRTSELIKTKLNLSHCSTSFQSRLGRAQWIEPSTESMIDQLLENGVKNVKVACPSFVADCLETLEEIGLELKNRFMSGGGESFELIPCVNDSDIFVKGLAAEIRKMGS